MNSRSTIDFGSFKIKRERYFLTEYGLNSVLLDEFQTGKSAITSIFGEGYLYGKYPALFFFFFFPIVLHILIKTYFDKNHDVRS